MDPTEDTAADEESPDDDWPIKEPREVLADRKLRYPPAVQEAIWADHPRGWSVYWNYDPDSDFVFISEAPARRENYQFIARNTIEDPDGEHTKIRAPKDLPARIRTKFELKGTYMVYLADRDMISDENPSAWILTWSQFTGMLPSQTESQNPDDDDVSRMITNNPGFLPSRLS
jgi:hypothetical protein